MFIVIIIESLRKEIQQQFDAMKAAWMIVEEHNGIIIIILFGL